MKRIIETQKDIHKPFVEEDSIAKVQRSLKTNREEETLSGEIEGFETTKDIPCFRKSPRNTIPTILFGRIYPL